MGSVASDYPLQTPGDFGDLYWATVSDLLKSSLQDYVTYSRKGNKCRFQFKHDTYLSDTDQDVSISADVKLSFVEGKGVAVTAIYGFSGTQGFSDTIRGYVSAGDLSNVIVSWFKTLSYDGKARSYYIDAWDDFSIALSNISEHPGFASAVSDAMSLNSSLVGGTSISSSKDALDSLYTDIVTTALRHYKIEFRDIIRREDYFTLDYETGINIQASAVKPLRQDVDQRLASVSLRAAADGSDKISVSVSFSLQAISKEVPYVSQYAGSGYVNTAEFSLKSDKEVSAFVSQFLSFLGHLQVNGYVYDHYCKEFEKFASKVSSQQAVSDAAGDKDMRGEDSNSLTRRDLQGAYRSIVAQCTRKGLLSYISMSSDSDGAHINLSHQTRLTDTGEDCTISGSVNLYYQPWQGIKTEVTYAMSPVYSQFNLESYAYFQTQNGLDSFVRLAVAYLESLASDGQPRSFFVDTIDDMDRDLRKMSERVGFIWNLGR